MKLLNSENVPTISRKDIVVDFLRPAMFECGERSCVNGDYCCSVLQFRQLWLKDSTLFKQCWKLSVHQTSGKILDETGREFEVFPLREYLCPETEKLRKDSFSKAMAKFLTTQGTSIGNKMEQNAKLSNWFSETIKMVNPSYPGYCILCLLRLLSELTTIFSSANIISNPKVCVMIQHHKNIFGVPGEYKSGFEIHRGANLCGLVGKILEYRVDNYLPGSAHVHYKTIEYLNSESSQYFKKNDPLFSVTQPSGSRGVSFTLAEKKIKVLQWVESDAMVCKPTEKLNFPKSSM